MNILCKTCDLSFHINPNEIRRGRKFCSQACYRKDVHSTRGILTLQDATDIREAYVPRKVSCQKLADLYGVHWDTIWNIVTFRTWV